MKRYFRLAPVVFFTLISAVFSSSVCTSRAASGTWTNLNGGSWSAAANWSGSVIGDGSGNTADFSTLGLTVNPTVTLDGARTIGAILFNDQNGSHSWTLNTGSAGPLTMAGTSPTITSVNSANTIGAVIAGTSGLTIAGPGALTLTNVNTFSAGTTLANGTVTIVQGAGLGTGTLNVTESAAGGLLNFLTVANTAAVTMANPITMPNAAGTYALTKNASGKITLSGGISGGGPGVILRTTSGTSGDTTTIHEFSGTSTFAGGIQLWRGIDQVDSASAVGSATIYGDANDSTSGDLTFGANMTFANSIVLQESETISPGTFNVILTGGITDGGSGYALTDYGTGTLTLAGPNSYTGGTVIGSSSVSGGTVALGVNNGLTAGTPLTIDKRKAVNSTFNLGTFNQNVSSLTLYAGKSTSASISSGGGTLVLSGNVNLIDAHTSSQDFPLSIAAPIDLNGATRTFSVGYGNNNDSSDQGDLHLTGVISNSTGNAGLTITGNAGYFGSVLLGAANIYNGPTTLAGSTTASQGTTTLGLGVNNAIPTNSAIIESAGNILDLTAWGASTGVSTGAGSLTGAGTITLGTTGALTVGYDNTSPAAYAGVIGGAGGQVVKVGTGTLALSGVNTYTGNTTVDGGTLLVNGKISGGSVSVAGGATLGGGGTITAKLSVTNGGSIVAGNGTGTGTLTVNSLNLGSAPGDALAITCSGTSSGISAGLVVANANGLTNNGTVTLNLTGALPITAPATYNLITYSGTIAGGGTFVTGSLPAQLTGFVSNNAAAQAVQLVITSAVLPSVTWVGSPNHDWNLLGSDVWTQSGTSTPAAFANGDIAVFDDTASTFQVNVATAVTPYDVVVSNSLNNYLFSGTGGIAGFGLTKIGTGTLTLSTTNNYTGATVISNGTLALGIANALPSGASAGGLVDYGTFDLNGFSPTLNNVSGTGVIDNVNAGGSPVLTLSNSTGLSFPGTIQNSSGSMQLSVTGGGTFTLTGTNTYKGGTVINGGSLQLGSGGINGTAGSGNITDNATLILNRSDTNTLLNSIAGNGNLQQNGSGIANLAGTLSYVGTTTVNAGALGLLTTFNSYMNQPLIVNAGAAVNSAATLNLDVNENGSVPSSDILGAGTVNLVSTTDSASNPDMFFGPDHSGTSFWGTRIAAATLNLGNRQRFIFANSGHNGVGKYGFTNADAQFPCSITGTGGLTIIAQMTWTATTPLMEVPFILMGSNNFTGPLEIQRGSVYLGNVNALTQTNVLYMNAAAGNNARLFLYGTNVTVGNLYSSAAGGSNVIANGNEKTGSSITLPAATLTVVQTTNGNFWGQLFDVQSEYDATGSGTTGSLNLVKTGPAPLNLNGSNSFTGSVTVQAGSLYMNSNSTGGGPVTVVGGATFGGYGSVTSPVTASNSATIEAGSGTSIGTLAVNSLVFGSAAGDSLAFNCDANPLGVASLSVLNLNGLTNNGTVTVNVNGVLPNSAPVVYTLISYSGSIKGSGSFVLGSVPDQAVAYLSNNTSASAIQLVVSSVTIPAVTWVGSPGTNWDLLGGDNWRSSGSPTPVPYADFDQVLFDDTASTFAVNLATNVSPDGVIISNNAANYNLAGAGAIIGYTGLTKQGPGSLTVATSNTYFGPTLVAAGTLREGAPGAIPSGAGSGSVVVNGTLDVNGINSTLNNLSGSGVVDDVTAGGFPVLTLANNSSSVFSGAIQNSSGVVALATTGNGTLSLSGNNTFDGATVINSGVLQIGNGGASGTLGPGPVNDFATLAFNRSDSNDVPNAIAGTGGLQQNGAGILNLSGNLTYTGPTAVNAGTLVFPNNVTFDAATGSTLFVASNAVMDSGFVLSLNANSSSTAVDISGPGTVKLVSTIDAIESFPDMFVGANNNGVTTANFGIRMASALDLGTDHRLVWALSSADDVTRYGLGGCDFQFAGPISGAGELSLLGKNSWPGVNTLEEEFALTASNSFTGPLEVLRGAVYLGNSNALTAGNVLILDPAASVNSRLFLYGYNASVSDLQSGGYGNIVIANGNNVSSTNVGPATLSVTENNPTTFAGDIMDWFTEYTAPNTGALLPTLSFVKNGPATLTLTGSNSYSGTTIINSGLLNVNGASTGAGAFTVNAGGILGGNGSLNSLVTVKSGGSVQPGDVTGNGTLTVNSLTLGTISGDSSALNLAAAAPLSVTAPNGLLINSGVDSVTINVTGTISSIGVVPLIAYSGSLGGTGFSSFQLGSLPPGVQGFLSNDTVKANIDFVATLVTIPRWTGALSSEWSVNVLSPPKNWVQNSDGVTRIDYVDGENVRFDDNAPNPNVSLSVAPVTPASVVISNNTSPYIISGNKAISGAGTLTKQGTGRAVLGTINTYSGNTVIASGTLTLGVTGAVPSGPAAGNVTVNGTLDLNGNSSALNNLSGSGIVDNLVGGHSPVVTAIETSATTFSGSLKNTSGSVGLLVTGSGALTLAGANSYSGATTVSNGTLLVNGSLANGAVTVQTGSTLGGTGVIGAAVSLAPNSSLNLTANSPLTSGLLTLNGTVTINVSGSVSSSNSATYVLMNYPGLNVTNLFQLAPVAGIFNSAFTATLNPTSNQLQLVVAPTKPTGTIADVRHVVVFMQENRSFDHYFGSLHGVHGYSDHVSLTFTNGNSDIFQPSGSSYELPFHTTVECLGDLAHDWSSTHTAWDSGKWDQWIASKGSETMAFYNRSDLPYYYSLADNFTICDEYHCSTMTSTDPNRLYLMTGMIDPTDTGGGPVIDNTEPANGWGTNWITYPQFLQKAGVSWKVYQASDNYDDNALAWFAAYKNAAKGTPLYVNGVTFAPSIASGSGFPADLTNLVTEFKNDVISNTLPSVTYIIGPDVGSEHPSWSPEDGEILTKGLLDALAANPQVYNSTVFILNYDENDGFFDHAVPINPPAGTVNEFVGGLPIGLGVRVPCIVVSPWSAGGYVCSQVFDHSSIIRFLEKWTGVVDPNISAWRRQVSGDLTSALDFAHPNTNYPALLASVQNDCNTGTTASPPAEQTVPVQESGALLERPLPYQPNALARVDCSTGNCTIVMTNTGAASVHFSIYANAYSGIVPVPFDVAQSNSASSVFNTTAAGGNYDFSCYGPNGFLRRFAGNVNADCGQLDSISYLDPYSDGFKVTLANPGASPVVFSVTNGWFSNSFATYTVPAGATNVVFVDASTNNGWYDLTVTASSDAKFLRRFAGHIEGVATPIGLISSENPSGFKDTVTFAASFVGYGTPTGSVQFQTNGVALGAPVALNGGATSLTTSALPRGANLVAAVYSGDLLNPPATNSLAQVVLNHPPVPGPAYYVRAANIPLLINTSQLLTNVTDADGDPVSLLGVGTDGFNLQTTSGSTLVTNGSYVFYTNSTPANVNDGFDYAVSDGNGGTSIGTVSIVMSNNVVGQMNPSLIVSSTNATLYFFGVPTFQYIVDRSTNLTPGIGAGWVPISTNLTPPSGIIQVKDDFQDLGIQVPPLPPAVFYRLRCDPN